MPQANINAQIAQLQNEINALPAEGADTARKEIAGTIAKTHAVLIDVIKFAKPSRNLQNFLETVTQAIAELYQVAISLEDEPNIERPKALLHYLSQRYQDTLVPMLTRLNNLAEESEDMQKITNLAYLGNEIMSCANQVYQFNEKMNPAEKIYGMWGTLLMMAGVGLTIQVLSVKDAEFNMHTALTMVALGTILSRLAIKQHESDPEADLTRKAITNTEKAIESSKEIQLGSNSDITETSTIEPNNDELDTETRKTQEVLPKKPKKATTKTIKKDTTKEEEPQSEKPSGLTAKFLSAIGFMKGNKE